MKQIGMLVYRNFAMVVMVLLVVAIALPFNQTAVAASTLSDDFNSCTFNNSFWTLDPKGLAGVNPVMSGMFSGPGKATMSMTVPAGSASNLLGTSYTFSADNTKAPRIWHAIPDADFKYKVKFQAPFQNAEDSFKIMGILVRDNTNTASPKYLRVDFNANSGKLNEFIGFLYYDINTTAHMANVRDVTDLGFGSPSTGGLYITLQYAKSTGTWTATYQVGDTSANTKQESFTTPGVVGAFTVTDIGLFVASTVNRNLGTSAPAAPGATMVVDYFANLNDPAFANPDTANDAIQLKVTKNGTGTGTVTWPTACTAGNVVTLTAAPAVGSSFVSWGGDASGTALTTNVTMDASKNVTATFNSTGSLTLPVYLPLMSR